jgi:osmoprotectant transport system permease protein
VLVAVLALVVDAVLALAQRLSTSPGLRLAAP